MSDELKLKLAALTKVILCLRFYDQIQPPTYYVVEKENYIKFNDFYPANLKEQALFYQDNMICMDIAMLKANGMVIAKEHQTFKKLIKNATQLHDGIEKLKEQVSEKDLIKAIDDTMDLLLQKKLPQQYMTKAREMQSSHQASLKNQINGSESHKGLILLGGLMIALGLAFMASGIGFIVAGTGIGAGTLGVKSGLVGVATLSGGLFFYKEGQPSSPSVSELSRDSSNSL